MTKEEWQALCDKHGIHTSKVNYEKLTLEDGEKFMEILEEAFADNFKDEKKKS